MLKSREIHPKPEEMTFQNDFKMIENYKSNLVRSVGEHYNSHESNNQIEKRDFHSLPFITDRNNLPPIQK